MALVNPVSRAIGGLIDLEVGGTVETSSEFTTAVATLDLSPYPGAIFAIEATLFGYQTAGVALTGTLDASVGTGSVLDGTGSAFLTEITPHLPVLVRFADGRSAVVASVSSNILATMLDAWTGAAAVAATARTHLRSYATYSNVVQVTSHSAAASEVTAGVLVMHLDAAGGLLPGLTGPAFIVRAGTSSADITSGIGNAEPTLWHATIRARMLVPAFV